jgi:hypothetical protein
MPSPLPRRLTSLLVLAVSVAALLLLSAGSALAGTAACHSAGAGHRTRACTAKRRAHKPVARHARKVKHAAKHAAKKVSPAGSLPATATRVAPGCEDGSSAVSAHGGASCADGSEPTCEAGSSLSSAGSLVYCTPDAEAGSSFNEATCASDAGGNCTPADTSEVGASTCQNGVPPTDAGDGTFACADGSEPRCPEGSIPAISNDDSTLVCDVTAGSEAGS